MDIKIAQIIARSTGAIIGFICHKFFVFKNAKTGLSDYSKQGIMYTLLVLFNILASGYLIYFFNTILNVTSIILLKIMTDGTMALETYTVLHFIFPGEKHDKD